MNPPLPLAWRDAMAAVPPGTFTQAEAAAGWPQALTPAQLARLQRPYTTHKDRTAYRACQVLEQTIAEAVASGALPHTVQEHSTPESWKEVTNAPDPFAAYFGDQGFASREWLDRDSRSGVTIRQRIPAKSWQTHHITAQAARAWLAAQGEAPSPHVAAWFVGAGLQPAEVGVSAAAAPAPHPAPAQAPRLLRKADLIAELEKEWPSIRADIDNQTRNGLKEAAYRELPGKKQGAYDVAAAKQWAHVNLKWKPRTAEVLPIPTRQNAGPWDALKPRATGKG